jgi:hypothetical protein
MVSLQSKASNPHYLNSQLEQFSSMVQEKSKDIDLFDWDFIQCPRGDSPSPSNIREN